ncbi:MAG: polysaccharide biosynthesis protein, partial [Clostridia bacterium]|nr:polysaccharide biosynthesis protein [Clostridia bacterium]
MSRGLGAVYRFFLPWIMGGGVQAQVGMGLFGMAYPLYTVMLGISTSGVPSAIAKMVSERIAAGDRQGSAQVLRLALFLMSVTGIVFAGAFALAAPYYAVWVARDERATLSILAIVPAIFFVSVLSAYRGFFQGLLDMLPYALSQILEQIVRIATMLLLAWLLLPLGIEYAAAGATLGASTGAVAALVYLVLAYRAQRHSSVPAPAPPSEPAAAGGLLRELVALSLPISLAGTVQPLMGMIDAAVVPVRLHAAGLGDRATALFGVLSGFVQPFILAPTVFTTALAMSLVPTVAAAAAGGRPEAAMERAAQGLRAMLLITLPAAAGLLMLAREIPLMFYDSREAGAPLAILAVSVVFMGIQQVSSGVLQGLGKPSLPMRNLFVGAVVKLVATWYLTALPALHINGAALATTLAFAASALLNEVSLRAVTGRPLDWAR